MRIPEIAFALLNGAADTPAKAENGNVSSLLPNATQIGWIAGALAGLMTENGALSAGAVADIVPAEVKEQYNAYIEEMKAGTFMK